MHPHQSHQSPEQKYNSTYQTKLALLAVKDFFLAWDLIDFVRDYRYHWILLGVGIQFSLHWRYIGSITSLHTILVSYAQSSNHQCRCGPLIFCRNINILLY